MRFRGSPFPQTLWSLFLVAIPLVLVACGGQRESLSVNREQLFTLGYGPGEDQIDLFQIDAVEAPLKTRILMREGIFYISNGNGAKVVRFSSFGDVLSIIYNPEKSPEPLLLDPTNSVEGAGRRSVQYPFRAVGEIAVDSRQTIYVEDRLPPERRVYDKDTATFLDFVVLRFDKEGKFLDYLGQEGVGGTPFPYIVGVYTTSEDDCVVISSSQKAWLVHWFDSKGIVRSSLRIPRDALPQPEGESGLITNLDHMVPDSSGLALLLKVDYYKEAVDPQTKARSGIDFAGSWLYRMDITKGSYEESWEIPAVEKTIKRGSEGGPEHYSRISEFLGVAGDRFFFVFTDDDGQTSLSVLERNSGDISRYSIDIAPDELYFGSLSLSPEGILSALLGTKYEARVVWWRFDKLFGRSGEKDR